MNSKLFTSKIHKFENLPEPKNATEEEQEASNISESSSLHKSINFKYDNDDNDKGSSRLFKKLKMENVDVQNDYEREIMQQQSNIGINDEVQNDPKLHSEEQDESEIPNDGF
ncbi:unnamed protein product [Rhizophagus irregularis]|nr:unnamed protein product [Rhizophagus irregularis]CAB5372594.1 unnamed protein product [Rhizophagus irregularis]